MSRQTARAARPEKTIFRCAIYTRKSTDDRLEQKFNLLDAQRLSVLIRRFSLSFPVETVLQVRQSVTLTVRFCRACKPCKKRLWKGLSA